MYVSKNVPCKVPPRYRENLSRSPWKPLESSLGIRRETLPSFLIARSRRRRRIRGCLVNVIRILRERERERVIMLIEQKNGKRED